MADKIEIECPECGNRVRFTLDDVAKQRAVRCSRGHVLKLHDQGSGARNASNALANLDKALKRFSK